MAALARLAGSQRISNAVDVGEPRESHLGEGPGRGGGVAPAGSVGADPVTDLEDPWALAPVQAEGAHQLPARLEQPEADLGADALEEGPYRLVVDRLPGPGHPRAELGQAGPDGGKQAAGVLHAPRPQHEAVGADVDLGGDTVHPSSIASGKSSAPRFPAR